MGELEELKKAFILDEDAEHSNIEELIKKTMNFCKIDKKGHVVLDANSTKSFKIHDKILLVMTARHLANKLQKKEDGEATITEEITAGEVADILREKKNVMATRLKELKDDKKITLVSRGIFKMAPYAVDTFLKGQSVKNNE